jgi:hypothetical protein
MKVRPQRHISPAQKNLCRPGTTKPSKYLMTVLVALLCLQSPAPAEYSEYEVKAAFLYKIISFVQWPEDAKPQKDAPYVIAILGEDPFKSALDDVVKSKTIDGHPITIKRSKEIDELGMCHLLFLPASESGRMTDVKQWAKGKNVLTVGEADNSAKQGLIVSLIKRDDRIRLEINVGAAREASLKINSHLLELAQIVGREEEKSGKTDE